MTANDDEFDVRNLPIGLVSIAELVGVDVARKLLEKFSGIAIYIPKKENLKPAHKLVEAVGMEAATKLSLKMAGEHLHVPTLYYSVSKKSLILDDLENGFSSSEIARKHDVTAGYVRRVRSGKIGNSVAEGEHRELSRRVKILSTPGSVETVARITGVEECAVEAELAPLRGKNWQMSAVADIRAGRGDVQEIAERYRCREHWVRTMMDRLKNGAHSEGKRT